MGRGSLTGSTPAPYTRTHQRIAPLAPQEHATTGVDQAPGPFFAGLLVGGQRGYRRALLDCVWSLAIAGVQRTRAVCRVSVLLSRVLVEAGVTPAVHLHGPAPLATPHHNP